MDVFLISLLVFSYQSWFSSQLLLLCLFVPLHRLVPFSPLSLPLSFYPSNFFLHCYWYMSSFSFHFFTYILFLCPSFSHLKFSPHGPFLLFCFLSSISHFVSFFFGFCFLLADASCLLTYMNKWKQGFLCELSVSSALLTQSAFHASF